MIRHTWNVQDFLDNMFVYGMELILIVFVLWNAVKAFSASDASNTESTQSQQIEAKENP